jgi:ATP-dependent Lhr-like helicase
MYTQELCLIQIADEKETFLIDALSVADLEPLRPILESTSITKIIHNAPFESRILGNLGFDIRAVCDTLKISRSIRGMSIRGGHGLATVCQRELDELIDKGEQTSNWKRRPLTDSQIDYAATDAEVLLRLHDVMTDRRPGTLL